MINCDISTYEQYTNLVDTFLKTDNREINYQNRVIIPLLDNLSRDKKGISVVDVSTQYKNRESKVHTRKNYANNYTPDLLIASNRNYNNINNDKIDYYAVIEIKRPFNSSQYQLSEYLATNISKVIWTNCLRWEFYNKNNKEKTDEFVFYDYENEVWRKEEDSNGWNDFCAYLLKFLNI